MVDSQMKQDSMLVQKNFTFAAFLCLFIWLFQINNCVKRYLGDSYFVKDCACVIKFSI